MDKNIPRVYDKDMNLVAYLENAFEVSYSLKLNELWTASFSLPADDPKNKYCRQFNYIEIYDGARRIELFRIIGVEQTEGEQRVNTYSCEHVLATLLNDVLFKYHQIGGLGIFTKNVLRYILDAQTKKNWVLGEVDFSRQFEYKWENENLLSALFSVPQCFDEEYRWEWDTTAYPWTIKLKAASPDIKSEIRKGKNMSAITREVDSTALFNRIYPLGYGEGDNQLGIADVNQGRTYLEDGTSVANYGRISTILVDSRFENPESLKAYAQALLHESKEPYISYTAEAIDIYRITGDDYTLFFPGDYVRVIDGEFEVMTRIIAISKSDIYSGNVSITLANKDRDIAGSISNLQSRARISETYSQGATNLMVQNFADNADKDNPAVIKVFIPSEAVRINKVLLNLSFEPFRGYTKAIEGGGERTSTTKSGGGYSETTDSGGSTTSTSESVTLKSSNITSIDSGGSGAANHNHGIEKGTYLCIADKSGGEPTSTVKWVPSGAHEHGAHSHTVRVPSHSHDFRIPSHSHSFTMPDHSHSIKFGIYEGSTAESATISVDDNKMPTISSYESIDLVPFLSKDNDGKIQRNIWHEIKITPDTLTRISASVFTQLFTNSRGNGDY